MKTPSTLADLAHTANRAHSAGEAAVRRGLEHFRTAGEALIKAKRQVGHGGWMAWMKNNLVFGYRQAARYMLLARRWDDGKLDSETNLSDALDALANGDNSRMAGTERRLEIEAYRKRMAMAAPPACATVRTGDFRECLTDIPDASVDLIFTDPPYSTATLPLYGDLAVLAARVLRPGGSLVAYTPSYNLPEVVERVRPHLRFWSTLTIRHTGRLSRLNYFKIVVGGKLLAWFVKGRYRGEWVMNVIDGDPPYKDCHDWQQGEGEATYCIERMCKPGDMVLDPMCGSGTSLLAALRLNRQALGCEIDEQRAKVATSRLKSV